MGCGWFINLIIYFFIRTIEIILAASWFDSQHCKVKAGKPRVVGCALV